SIGPRQRRAIRPRTSLRCDCPSSSSDLSSDAQIHLRKPNRQRFFHPKSLGRFPGSSQSRGEKGKQEGKSISQIGLSISQIGHFVSITLAELSVEDLPFTLRPFLVPEL